MGPILGFIAFLIVIAVVIGIGIALGWIPIGNPGRGNVPAPDPIRFDMSPKIICSKQECSVEIDYMVQSSQAAAAVSLTVLTPSNNTIVISDQMQLQQSIAGDDAIWNDGPGQYIFTWRATGLRQGNVTNVHDVHVIPPAGGTVLDFISFTFDANTQNRRVAGDIAVFGAVSSASALSGLKVRELDTCEKYMALSSIRYVSGGLAGYPNELSIQISDGTGQPRGYAILTPQSGSDTLTLSNPIPIQDGIAIQSQMSSGTGPEFPIGQSITWDLEYTFKCL
jgi:hypothetical protein